MMEKKRKEDLEAHKRENSIENPRPKWQRCCSLFDQVVKSLPRLGLPLKVVVQVLMRTYRVAEIGAR